MPDNTSLLSVCSLRALNKIRLCQFIVANAILNSNLRVPLRGAAIGNGWIDARRQYPSYLDFAVRIGELEQNSEVSSSLLSSNSFIC